MVEGCFRENRKLIARAAACKKATMAELKVRPKSPPMCVLGSPAWLGVCGQDLVAPLQAQMSAAAALKDRRSEVINHITGVCEGLPALMWVTMVRAPAPAACC